MNNFRKVLFPVVMFALFVAAYFGLSNNTSFFEKDEQLNVNTQVVEPQRLFLNSWQLIKNKYYDPTLNSQDWYRWKKHYLNNIKTENDAYVAISSMLASLNDPYSKFLTPHEFFEQNMEIDAKVFGIGVNITTISGKFIVLGVIENSPALKSGIKPGDIILAVDNQYVNGQNIVDVADLIRGPVGTQVKLKLLRGKTTLIKTIKREEVLIKDVRSKIIDSDIGYIKIYSFISSNLTKEFDEALKKTAGTKGLIIDLRGNPGGILQNALDLVDLYIERGTIVSIKGRNGIKTPIMAQYRTNLIKKPTVILINKESASASEIFSGALKDYNKAVLVGERSYGKGMIQKIFPMPNQTGMNLTIAKYLTPAGFDINKSGIEPNYEVFFTDEDFKHQKDPQLSKAIEVLKKMIKS